MNETKLPDIFRYTPPIESYTFDDSFELIDLGFKRTEVAPLRQFLKAYRDSILAYWGNYPLLDPKDIPNGLTQSDIRQSMFGKGIKPDLIVVNRSHRISIVEHTPKVTARAIGQVLLYTFLYYKIYQPETQIQPIVIGDSVGYQVLDFAESMHVEVLLRKKQTNGHFSHWYSKYSESENPLFNDPKPAYDLTNDS